MQRGRRVGVDDVPGPQREQVHARVQREEARDDLFRVHLEREEQYRPSAPRDAEAHPKREARLANRRPRREDDEVAGGEALGVVIDLAETRGNAADLERPLHALGQVLVVRLQRRGDVPQLRVGGLVAQREEPLLGAVERERDVGGFVVGVGGDRSGRAEQPSQDGSVAHHSRVALDLDGGGYRVRERVQVRLAACAVELLAPRKLDLDGERIDSLTAFEEGLRRVVDPLVSRDVEVVDAQEVGHLEDGIAIDEEASEHLLLGAFVERDLFAGGAGTSLEGHAG